MATTKAKKAKKLTIPEDDNGNPDIYLLMTDHDMSVDEAAEAAGITGMKAWRLSLIQEVEHNPELRVPERTKKNRAKLASWVAKQRDVEKVRWEKLMARTGLSKTELQELYEEATGEAPGRLRGGNKADQDEEDPKPKKAAKAKKGKVVAQDPDEDEDDEDEDDDQDDEDLDDEADDDEEDEEPVAKPARKARGRAKK